MIDSDGGLYWEPFLQDSFETTGTWLGVVPAGFHVIVQDAEFRWIERAGEGELVTGFMRS